jgi:hypothetical protein
MADLDLLIRPRELAPAREALRELGYEASAAGDHSHVLRKGKSYTKIDLHLEISHLPPDELRAFIHRSERVELDGAPLSIPRLEDHVILTAVHAVVLHGHLRPMWLEDIHRLISCQLDWEAVLRRARRLGVTLPLWLAIKESCRVKGSVVPPEVFSRLSSPGGSRMQGWVLERILRRPEIPDMGHLLRFFFLRRQVLNRHFLKMGALYRQLFPGREFLKRRYGLESKISLLLHAVARPFLTARRALRLLYRIITLKRERQGYTWGETP